MRRGRVLIKDSLTEFPELNEILRELAERAAAILGDNFVGAYLQGSFAVGNADQFSDVDFLIPTHGLITRDQEVQLRAMHAKFPDRDSAGRALLLLGSLLLGSLAVLTEAQRIPPSLPSLVMLSRLGPSQRTRLQARVRHPLAISAAGPRHNSG